MPETERNDVVALLREAVLTERLAAVEHERWAHWQSYLHAKGHRHPDGSLTLPADLVKQWDDQIARPYEALTEREKDSDREQVARYLPLIEAALRQPGPE